MHTAAAAVSGSSGAQANTLQQQQQQQLNLSLQFQPPQQQQEDQEQEFPLPVVSPVESLDSDYPFSLNLPSVASYKAAILGQQWDLEEQQYEGEVVEEGEEFEEETSVGGAGGSDAGSSSSSSSNSRFDGAWASDMKRVHLEESLGVAPGFAPPKPSANDKTSSLPVQAAKDVLATGEAVSVVIVEGAGHAIHEERPEALLPLIRLFASRSNQASME
ncbi:hypothetical protein CLOM_g23294 [Closterium sp. NIES-68]|nr:hypothetical protein CLOM_g23294 [Closterium sp. NIES-68]